MKKIQKLFSLTGLFILLSYSARSFEGNEKEKLKAFMIDAPRTIETIDYYFRLIDFLHEKKFNAIIFRLTDDQGSAYLFTSHPELKMCEGAFTQKELRSLVEYAQSKSIEMIPEIESFGHSQYITQTKRYQFLDDSPPGVEYNALCPVNDTTLALMKDLYTEVAPVFSSEYFHIGCDEVNWGGSQMSKQALKSKSKQEIWAEYVNKLNGYIKSLGKKTIIWGDVPIYNQSEIFNLLNKDIVITDWNYSETNKMRIDSIARAAIGKGFKVMGCPAVNWCKWGPRINGSQFDNINAYSAVYLNLDDSNNLGIIISNWIPKRYLQNSQWDAYSIAAEIVKNKGDYKYMDALPAFVKDHFGAAWDANWEEVYKTIYKNTPQWKCGENDSLKFVPWHSEQQIKFITGNNKRLQNPNEKIIDLLLKCRSGVTKNINDFNDLLLTVEFISYSYNRQNGLTAFAESGKTDIKSVNEYIRKVALEDEAMIKKLDAAWSVGRRSKPKDTDEDYLWSFHKASGYSKYLSEHPAELIKILSERKNK